MSGYVDESLRLQFGPREVHHAVVASVPTDLSDTLSVVIPDFDSVRVWENCKWQARDDVSLPGIGDQCLVVLTNRRELVVIFWWPFS